MRTRRAPVLLAAIAAFLFCSSLGHAQRGDVGSNQPDTQDGRDCPPHTATFLPEGPTLPNSPLIGASPFDLGAQLQGAWRPPTWRTDPSARYHRELLGEVFGDRPNYGTALALGSFGTVAPPTGAFAHPFTLLSLPSDAGGMGLLLRATYASNVSHPATAYKPFGPGFHLSGMDFLLSGYQSGEQPQQVYLYRGDGSFSAYNWNGVVYESAAGQLDRIEYQSLSPGSFRRHLPDGRTVFYLRSQPSGSYFVRDAVKDLNGLPIDYDYGSNWGLSELPELESIVDTRGVRVVFTWSNVQVGSGQERRVSRISLDPATLPNLTPPANPLDLGVDFTYETTEGKLETISYLPMDMVRDADGSGTINLNPGAGSELFVAVHPAVRLTYSSSQGNKLVKIEDLTFAAAPETRLSVAYQQDATGAWQVVRQVEGDDVPTTQDPVHVFSYPSPLQRTYTDPRSTFSSLTLDTLGRVTSVTMTASATAVPTGKPRQADGFSDHASLVWTLAYGCGCGLPSSVQTPEGRTFGLTWDQANGLLQSLNLTAGGLTRTYQLGYGSFLTASGGTARLLTSYTDPLDNVWSYTYTFASGKLTNVKATSPGYIDANGIGQSPIEIEVSFGPRGEITELKDGEGTRTTIAYKASGAGRQLPERITLDPSGANVVDKVVLDDLGRLVSVEEGEGSGRTTSYTCNLYYHAVATITPPAGGSVPIRTESYLDRRANPTVSRRENRSEAGALRARPWIVAESLHDRLDRPVRSNADDAALDAAASSILTRTYAYTNDHVLWKIHQPDGSTVRRVTDGYGLYYKTVLDDGGLNVTPERVFLDRDGYVVEVKDGNGRSVFYNRNALRELDDLRDAENGKFKLHRDGAGRVYKIDGIEVGATERLLRQSEVAINAVGQVTQRHRRLLDSQGTVINTETVKLFYNRRHQPTEMRQPLERGWKAIYDSAGRTSLVRDRIDGTGIGPGNEAVLAYETVTGRLSRITRRDVVANDFGIPPASSTMADQETELIYDLLDRVTTRKVKREVGSTTGPAEVVHTFAYDSFDFEVRYQDSNGAKVERMLDPFGRVRMRREVGTQGGAIQTLHSYVWNATETKVVRTDGMSPARVTTYLYDTALRLTEQRHPGYQAAPPENRRLFTYDAASNVHQITLGNGTVVVQLFDGMNRLKQRVVTTLGTGVSTMATQELFTYDALGQVATAETLYGFPGINPLSKVTMQVDSLDRLLSERFVMFAGQSDRTVSSAYQAGASEDFLWRRKLTYPSAFEVETTPDGVGKLQTAELKVPGGATSDLLAQYRYAGSRPLERRLFSGAGASVHQDALFGWDGQRRLMQLQTRSSSGSELWRWDFSLGPEGHLLQEKHYVGEAFNQAGSKYHQLTQYYSLDDTKEGVPEPDFNGPFSSAGFTTRYDWTLDSGHNRTQETVQTGSGSQTTSYVLESDSHRYQTVDGTTHQYDGEGNLRFDGQLAYKYDFRNRLSEVYRYIPPLEGAQGQSSGTGLYKGMTTWQPGTAELQRLLAAAAVKWLSGTQLASGFSGVRGSSNSASSAMSGDGTLQLVAYYGYDPFNRRVYRALPGQPMLYSLWDGWREVEEVSQVGAGQPIVEERAYVWGGVGIDELLCYARKQGSTWTRYYAHQDRMSSTHRLVDGTGATVERYSYAPYGRPTVYNGAGQAIGTTSAIGNPYLWTGRRRDPETGLYYFRNRYYAPAIGRFLTEDPLGVWGDIRHYGNPYAYVGNTPFDHLDPLGLGIWDWIQGGLDVIGLVPLVGEPADLLNAAISAARGDHTGAALSAAAAVPFVGAGATAAKAARNIDRAIDAAHAARGGGRTAGKGTAVEFEDVAPPPPGPAPGPKGPKGPTTGPHGAKDPCPPTKGPDPGAKPTDPGAARGGPPANHGDAKPHGGPAHDQAIDDRIGQLRDDPSVENIRKNQVQVDAQGNRVGNNRPDLQYDRDGVHNNVEYDTNRRSSERHRTTIERNDPNAKNEFKRVGDGS